ncbi:MAG: GDP-L-fucose synthase [Magnetococcus sp. DMHC-6]
MNKSDSIFIAGHRGLVGSALVRSLQKQGFDHLLTRTHAQLDLTNQRTVEDFFQQERPKYLFLAAARVGGIYANDTYPADFIRDNLQIQTNVIDSAWKSGVEKLLFLGSSCIYPRAAAQPMREEYLLTGPLESTNEWYAIAKMAGIKMCQAYRKQFGFSAISVMPTNLYGPGDNFHNENAHVLPALMRRFHEAKVRDTPTVTVWGTGRVRREFLFVDDLADACLFLMDHYNRSEPINIGTGQEVTIAELVDLMKHIVDYSGTVFFDPTKPEGTPRKLLDVSQADRLGWHAKTSLEEGIKKTYAWFIENLDAIRR